MLLNATEAAAALILPPTKRLVGSEIPKILQHAARALLEAPFGGSLQEWMQLSAAQWLQLAPILTCLSVGLVLVPLCLLGSGDSGGADRRHTSGAGSYWLTRLLLLRMMGAIYLSAFLTSAFQSRGLFGSLGLLPVSMESSQRPTPFFSLLQNYTGWAYDDCMLELTSWLGVFLSLQMILGTVTSALLPAALWALYLSIVNLGSIVINYGWEWLTLEAGFLLIFLCPLRPSFRNPFPAATPPSMIVLWLFRWLAFRLMIGAGMSKVGGNSSACWRELTCTETHYFTQPMPNPLAWWAHALPAALHHTEVALTFFEQLILPFFVLVPCRPLRLVAGCLALSFQLAIVGTGNYAW